MMATGLFRLTSWDEKPYSEIEGRPKLTHAHTTNVYTGDIAGESVVDYVMAYPSEIEAIFSGFERITGSIHGHEGSVVLRADGRAVEQDDTWATTTQWTIIEGSGTGALSGITGKGEYTAIHGVEETPIRLRYTSAD